MDLHLPPATLLPREAPSNLLNRSCRTTHIRAWGALGTMLVAAVAALSITLLGGCGGGEGGDEHAGAADSAPSARKATTVDFTLESEYGPGDAPGSATHGRVTAAAEVAPEGVIAAESRAAVPVDRQAHTRGGRYISRATAERIDAQTGGRIVWVDASCCAGLDAEVPEGIAFGMLAVLGEESSLYVTGNDLRQAARLADRLDTLGLRRVYLVTP